MRITILGAGRAGHSLAKTLSPHFGTITPLSFRGEGDFGSPKSGEDQPDILFLATRDSTLPTIAATLATQPTLPKIVAYLAGSHSLEILKPIAHKTSIAQFHPLVSLDGEAPIPPQTLIAICATQLETREILHSLASRMSLNPVDLNDGAQPLYHAAASLTGNLSLALVAYSIELMQQAGIAEELARPALGNLLQSAAQAVSQKRIRDALTGPIARNDRATISTHLETLDRSNRPDIAALYRQLTDSLVER